MLVLAAACLARPSQGVGVPQLLVLEARIPLGEVRGRIDHLAIDADGERLAVAELAQETVGLVDLRVRKALSRIEGLEEPQGVTFVGPDVVVATGDGWVRRYSSESLRMTDQIRLGDDADNVRARPGSGDVLVGYGTGALAVLDPQATRLLFKIALAAHPESFQFGRDAERVYVNLPGRHRIDIVSMRAHGVVASLGTGLAFANHPMAIDPATHRLIAASRIPREVRAYDLADHHLIGSMSTCGDADDVFADARRNRLYVICGEGAVDILRPSAEGYVHLGRIDTAPGARIGLWSETADRLYIAAPKRGEREAEILAFKPAP